MSPDEVLIGSVALFSSLVAFSIGIGPWLAPYRLRTFDRIDQRFGKAAARMVWIAISIALLAAGLVILAGIRPGYTVPTSKGANVEGGQRRTILKKARMAAHGWQ